MENRFNVEFETDSEGKPVRIIIPEEMLEHSSQTADEILAHYGVAGMKWGVRRGGLRSRIKGAARDSVQRRATTNREIAEGRSKGRDKLRVAIYRKDSVVGMQSKRAASYRARTLEARLKRMDTGKATAKDVLEGFMNSSTTDLFVSRTDKRGKNSKDIKISKTLTKGEKEGRKILLALGTAVVVATAASEAARRSG